MNNKEFINALSSRLQKQPQEIKQQVDALVGAMADMLDEGATLTVQGFGTYEVKKKKERIIVHPTTKQRQLVPPKLAIAFKPSPTLKDKVNE